MSGKLLSQGPEWSFELIERYDREIARIAANYGLDTYPNQIEVISAEQMMDAYSSVGMPVNYQHWSFGKEFIGVEQIEGPNYTAYRVTLLAFPLMTFGLLSGAIWADEIWGTYWGWDVKEVWSLITSATTVSRSS